MRNRLTAFLRDDAAMTAVEYAVLAGLVIAVAGAAAYQIGGRVRHSTAVASAASAGAHAAALRSHAFAAVHPASAAGPSFWTLSLLSVAVIALGVGAYFGGARLMQTLRTAGTRRRVRASLRGPDGQAALGRLARATVQRPDAPYAVNTRLIGRNMPEMHRWVRGRAPVETAAVAFVSPRPAASSAPPPTASVAG